jgi:ABC-type uncharacterized transport system substrate-binding protein
MAEDGGLMAYGPTFAELDGRAASFVDQILKGANPGNLAIEQPTKFELVIQPQDGQGNRLDDLTVASRARA